MYINGYSYTFIDFNIFCTFHVKITNIFAPYLSDLYDFEIPTPS